MGAADVCTEVLAADMVFGSDDEKALVNALHTAFPAADHVYCARHIKENVRRHLTEKGVSHKDKDKVLQLLQCCMSDVPDDRHEALVAAENLMSHVRSNHNDPSAYFENHVIPKVRNVLIM